MILNISCEHTTWSIYREREEPPRFARPGTFEFEYSKRWKSLDEMEKQQRQQVEKNMLEAREKLESEMEDAYHEHQANLLRQGKFSGNVRFHAETMTCPLSDYIFNVTHMLGYCSIKCVCFLFRLRSAETPRGTTAYGGAAQSGDAKEKGDAAQVTMLIMNSW